ncbi:hypothetical protein DRO69_11770 [Candidatus Bathyarchaeota archaeon]|nr:MAG: hypothetical protein DRO69_11770 [Candidatus Bathyarchaeota archaeon]
MTQRVNVDWKEKFYGYNVWQIIDLYLQCLTQQEIADKIGYSQRGVSETIQKFKNKLSDNPIIPESLQLYNVWNFPNRDTRYGFVFVGH